jgi:hypothetical protein
VLPSQLHLEEEQRRLRLVQDHQPARLVQCHLSRQLRSDGAGGAGDENAAPLQVPRQFRQLQLHRFPAQQVLDAHLAELTQPDVAIEHLANARQHLEREPHLLT